MRDIRHFIGGKAVAGHFGPLRRRVQSQHRRGAGPGRARPAVRVEQAVAAAWRAHPAWAATNPQRRARVHVRVQAAGRERTWTSWRALLSSEHGKVSPTPGDIQRGLEVVEFACGIPHLLKGEYTEGAGPGIDVYSMRQPLGVVAGITPFNFPAMIPMWMFAVAIACGNAFILKPSERDPSVPMRLAELFIEAGGPPGILNVVHGDKEAVDAILDPSATSGGELRRLVGIAAYVYATGAAHGKRVQAWAGPRTTGS